MTPRLSPVQDSFLAGLLASIDADALEIRERIDYRTAADLTPAEWFGAIDKLASDARELTQWCRTLEGPNSLTGSRCSDSAPRQDVAS